MFYLIKMADKIIRETLMKVSQVSPNNTDIL